METGELDREHAFRSLGGIVSMGIGDFPPDLKGCTALGPLDDWRIIMHT